MVRHNSKSLIGAMYQEDISLWLNRMKKDYQRKHITLLSTASMALESHCHKKQDQTRPAEKRNQVILMGLFSRIFGGKSIKSAATSTSFLGAYRVAGGQSYSGGGWGLDRFNSIIDAHSSVDDMIEEWGLADEGCRYQSLDGYSNPYEQAYREERERAEEEAEVLAMFGEEIDVELLIDWDTVEENAYEYAEELAQAWLDGDEWIPEEIMDWAWYDLSDHNM